mmetsp:Transcript_10257/g.29036  ORF Transcript_10257/g.29036 Transcript_10257/m.29036 type:complete len:215 (+) Transcript_10257:890-1534(+)
MPVGREPRVHVVEEGRQNGSEPLPPAVLGAALHHGAHKAPDEHPGGLLVLRLDVFHDQGIKFVQSRSHGIEEGFEAHAGRHIVIFHLDLAHSPQKLVRRVPHAPHKDSEGFQRVILHPNARRRGWDVRASCGDGDKHRWTHAMGRHAKYEGPLHFTELEDTLARSQELPSFRARQKMEAAQKPDHNWNRPLEVRHNGKQSLAALCLLYLEQSPR